MQSTFLTTDFENDYSAQHVETDAEPLWHQQFDINSGRNKSSVEGLE